MLEVYRLAEQQRKQHCSSHKLKLLPCLVSQSSGVSSERVNLDTRA